MFTGLIETVGTAVKLERQGDAARLTVTAAGFPAEGDRLGDSIAVNGVCLTVVRITGGELTFDVSPETFKHSTFHGFTAGTRVNLERSLRLSDRLGGHLVTGHVDCVATLVERRQLGKNTVLTFRLSPESARCLVEKGSVAVDGISLTINAVNADSFSVNVIPHTSAATTLALLRAGDRANIETDILGKYVQRLLSAGGEKADGGLSFEILARNGFV